jgi:hypothetical protein
MQQPRNDYDVTNSVKTTDPVAVAAEVRRIYVDLYRKDHVDEMERPFHDFAALYNGEHPKYYACDTSYHDTQHVLDVTLAMARLLDGYQRAGREPLGERLFRLGVILALYHDCGYIRHRKDTRHHNGAEYTLTHVSRGARYLRTYLPQLGMADLAMVGARVVHFTGYEVPIDQIKLPQPIFRVIGNLLGSADILGQMADRCYLEKCYDRLFPEFVLGGLARRRNAEGKEEVVFGSAADLMSKTPGFYKGAAHRLDAILDNAYHYAERHFGGHNYYVEAVEKNIGYARKIGVKGDMSRLRRHAPQLVVAEQGPRHEQPQPA